MDTPTDTRAAITHFTGRHAFLSNFFPCPLRLDDGDPPFPTLEHAYQASKTTNRAHRHAIALLRTPGQAKRAGSRLQLRPNWNQDRILVMRDLLAQKFSYDHPALRAALLLTAPAQLIETNTWGDTFWGVCNGTGSNHLGRLLMLRREILSLDTRC